MIKQRGMFGSRTREKLTNPMSRKASDLQAFLVFSNPGGSLPRLLLRLSSAQNSPVPSRVN